MEKRSPAYDLDSIKATFSTVATLRITRTATRDYRALGFTATDVVTCIQGLQRTQLYKSMTSDQDHRIWQDVYHASHEGIQLYVKFTIDGEGHLLISFKER